MNLSPQFQDRKSSVAASAFQVLAEGGLEKLSFRAVADAARCSLGRVVHYYPTKQELVLDAIEETGGEMLAGMDEIERRLPANEALGAVLSCALPISPRPVARTGACGRAAGSSRGGSATSAGSWSVETENGARA